VAGEVEEELLAGVMVLAHHEIELSGVSVIGLGEPGVSEAVGMALPVLGPQQSLGDAGTAQLGVNDLPVRGRTSQDRGRRSGSSKEPFF
jgi:hypothetical protein